MNVFNFQGPLTIPSKGPVLTNNGIKNIIKCKNR